MEVTRYAVPGWGAGELWLRDGVLLAHAFDFAVLGGDSSTPPMGAVGAPSGTVDGKPPRRGDAFVSKVRQPRDAAPLCGELTARFRAFLAGELVDFADIELDLGWATPFQEALTRALRAIPRGEVVTYGELAALAGRPGAARAAGTFCASNRFAFVVPCHRVVAAGGIGGYGPDGVPIKRRLLALEGVRL